MNRKRSINITVTTGDSHVSAPIVDLDESNFDQTISESSVPILVDFFASWCGPCRVIAPLLDEIANEEGDKVKIGKIDVDHSPSLTSRFGIRNVPTLLFFKDGEVKDQVVGLTNKANLISRLKTLN